VCRRGGVCYATSQVDDEEEENMSMGGWPGHRDCADFEKGFLNCYTFVATHGFFSPVAMHGHIY
jgi:hypothetical protein